MRRPPAGPIDIPNIPDTDIVTVPIPLPEAPAASPRERAAQRSLEAGEDQDPEYVHWTLRVLLGAALFLLDYLLNRYFG